MVFNDLTDEQKAKARGLRTPEEMLAFAREEGFEITDEQLEAVSGGLTWADIENCKSYCAPKAA